MISKIPRRASCIGLLISLPWGAFGAERRVAITPNGLTCAINAECVFPNEIYVCNFADAEEITSSEDRAETARKLFGVKRCEMTTRQSRFKAEGTKSPDIIYLTENGRHVGYSAIGVFAQQIDTGAVPSIASNNVGLSEAEKRLLVTAQMEKNDLPGLTFQKAIECFALGGTKVESSSIKRISAKTIVQKLTAMNGDNVYIRFNVTDDQVVISRIDLEEASGEITSATSARDIWIYTTGSCAGLVKRNAK